MAAVLGAASLALAEVNLTAARLNASDPPIVLRDLWAGAASRPSVGEMTVKVTPRETLIYELAARGGCATACICENSRVT